MQDETERKHLRFGSAEPELSNSQYRGESSGLRSLGMDISELVEIGRTDGVSGSWHKCSSGVGELRFPVQGLAESDREPPTLGGLGMQTT